MMAIQKASCPSCGAPVALPENINQTKCPYCSTLLILEHSRVPPLPTSHSSSARQKNTVAPIGYTEGWLSLLFSFNGRITRQQFWIGFGIVCVIMFIAGRFTNSVTDPTTGLATVKFNFIGSLIVLADLWIFVAVSSKRFHDRAKSGWWTAIYLVPFGFFWVIYQLGFLPSKSDSGMKFG